MAAAPIFAPGFIAVRSLFGELGYLKKEIALIGDFMNTAARIQEACRATGCRVLASAALIERISALPVGLTSRSLGPLPIRGKEQPIVLYASDTRRNLMGLTLRSIALLFALSRWLWRGT